VYKIRVLFIVIVVFITGCSTVSVIQPVALQNSRNADALNKNLELFFDADEPFFSAVMQAQLIDEYKEIILSIQKNDNPNLNDLKKIAEYYQKGADVLKNKITELSELSRENEKLHYYKKRPLTAEVAFSGMLPEIAASKWIAFKALRHKDLSDEEQFKINQKTFRDLFVIVKIEQATVDLINAYKARMKIILEQSANAKLIAEQLEVASNASYDAGKFLKGVMENDELVVGLTQYIMNTTNDPEKKAAAEELLNSIKSEK
jgi:hypothetical protein